MGTAYAQAFAATIAAALAPASTDNPAQLAWTDALSNYLRMKALADADSMIGDLFAANDAFTAVEIELEAEFGKAFRSMPAARERLEPAHRALREAEDRNAELIGRPLWAAEERLLRTPAPDLQALLFKVEYIRREKTWNDVGISKDAMGILRADAARLASESNAARRPTRRPADLLRPVSERNEGCCMTTDHTTAQPALKLCPFCGSARLKTGFTRATDDFAFWSVECAGCGVEVADDESQDAANAAWNRRPAADMEVPRGTEPPASQLRYALAIEELAHAETRRLAEDQAKRLAERDATIEKLRADLRAERLKPCRHARPDPAVVERDDLYLWQTAQREWFDETILEIVGEYAAWRDGQQDAEVGKDQTPARGRGSDG